MQEKGGDWIALSKAPTIFEERAHHPIHRNNGVATTDQMYEAVHVGSVETFGQENIIEKRLAN